MSRRSSSPTGHPSRHECVIRAATDSVISLIEAENAGIGSTGGSVADGGGLVVVGATVVVGAAVVVAGAVVVGAAVVVEGSVVLDAPVVVEAAVVVGLTVVVEFVVVTDASSDCVLAERSTVDATGTDASLLSATSSVAADPHAETIRQHATARHVGRISEDPGSDRGLHRSSCTHSRRCCGGIGST